MEHSIKEVIEFGNKLKKTATDQGCDIKYCKDCGGELKEKYFMGDYYLTCLRCLDKVLRSGLN